ncbi:DUF397 domain-containing protein [Actinomadura rubrisoli]|uniref:DUF397 domain-containing protein n=1 Tax=Actinomadura rubrisoli TaxID=2530368 RepID=A0A4R5BFN1_9ACTN|nr:DUF397 domain-containing protein [Actinomadura rubrisoli]TDD82624.1 DUF397 domain-containing protein [Actinomadura rubrisoli]
MSVWRKSSHSGTSGNSDCVEVADLVGTIGMRDSKDPHGPKIALPTASFRELLADIKRGAHDAA